MCLISVLWWSTATHIPTHSLIASEESVPQRKFYNFSLLKWFYCNEVWHKACTHTCPRIYYNNDDNNYLTYVPIHSSSFMLSYAALCPPDHIRTWVFLCHGTQGFYYSVLMLFDRVRPECADLVRHNELACLATPIDWRIHLRTTIIVNSTAFEP